LHFSQENQKLLATNIIFIVNIDNRGMILVGKSIGHLAGLATIGFFNLGFLGFFKKPM